MSERLEEPLDLVFADCGTCTHLVGGTCPAFPQGIPADIWGADVKHREVRPDQVGDLVYKERTD